MDAGYRGNVKVILTNLSDRAKEIETGDRIAQVLFAKKEETEFKEVSEFDQTERYCKGFGSSGNFKKKMAEIII